MCLLYVIMTTLGIIKVIGKPTYALYRAWVSQTRPYTRYKTASKDPPTDITTCLGFITGKRKLPGPYIGHTMVKQGLILSTRRPPWTLIRQDDPPGYYNRQRKDF